MEELQPCNYILMICQMVSNAVAPAPYKGLRVKCDAWLYRPHHRTCNRVLAVQKKMPEGIEPALTGFGQSDVADLDSPYITNSRPYLRSEVDGQTLTIWCKCGAPWKVDFEALRCHRPLDESKVEGWVDVSTSEL